MVTVFIILHFHMRFHLIFKDKELRLFCHLYDRYDTSFIEIAYPTTDVTGSFK